MQKNNGDLKSNKALRSRAIINTRLVIERGIKPPNVIYKRFYRSCLSDFLWNAILVLTYTEIVNIFFLLSNWEVIWSKAISQTCLLKLSICTIWYLDFVLPWWRTRTKYLMSIQWITLKGFDRDIFSVKWRQIHSRRLTWTCIKRYSVTQESLYPFRVKNFQINIFEYHKHPHTIILTLLQRWNDVACFPESYNI